MNTLTDIDRDRLFLASVAFAEASSEGQDGIRAQVWSVINRHNAKDASGRPRWYAGATLAATCLLPYAYSAMDTDDPNRVRAAGTSLTNSVFALCLAEVDLALSGQSQDPTDGATHYYRQGTPVPTWVTGIDKSGRHAAPPATFTKQILRHLFYKDVT